MSFSTKLIALRRFSSIVGDIGRGAGKSGGCGGAIRNAGGGFGRMEAAHENEYFYHLQEEQISEMKDHLEEHQAAHKAKINEREKLFKAAAEQRAKLAKTQQIE